MSNELQHRLRKYLDKQISAFFEFDANDSIKVESCIPEALKRTLFCFSHVKNKYYESFDPYHGGQYSIFLYYLSNSIYRKFGANDTSSKIYCLNKTMGALDLYYQVNMPDIFFWEHPVGTVLGRAKYANNFTIYQNCTVGGSWWTDGENYFPEFAENVTLFSYACVLGKCNIGKNTIISSHAYILNRDIPENSVVFGQGRNLVIKPNNSNISFFK
jgi:serine O-acetyltransferase